MKFNENLAKTFESLKIRNYRLYFIGQGVSLCGTWMQNIALSWLVLKITGSGTAVGGVLAFQYLPIFVLGPFGGVLADRYQKRKILYLTQSLLGLSGLLLAIITFENYNSLWLIYFISFFIGLVSVVDNPARQTFVHEMVGGKNLKNAVALNSTEVNLARVIGPAIAGILIVKLGIAFCFLVNAFSFMAVVYCISRMKIQELIITETITEIKGQMFKGFKYAWETKLIRNLILMMLVIGTLAYEFPVSLALMAKYTFNGDARSFALLTSALGLGAVNGGLFAASRKHLKPVRLGLAAFLFGLMILLVSIAPSLILAELGMIAVGFFSINFASVGNATLQLTSDPSMRGRVMALWSVAFTGSTFIGAPIVGWVGQHFDPRFGLGIGGAATVITGLYGLIILRHHSVIEQPVVTGIEQQEVIKKI